VLVDRVKGDKQRAVVRSVPLSLAVKGWTWSHIQALRPPGEASPLYSAWGELLSGQAGAAGPKLAIEEGLAQAAEAGSVLQAMGSGMGHAAQLLVQAQMLAQTGQAERALR
jgi:hypothetical protein